MNDDVRVGNGDGGNVTADDVRFWNGDEVIVVITDVRVTNVDYNDGVTTCDDSRKWWWR